ncbi:hypothetical protein DYB37_012761 [Aphanomyces astaci]|uniref:HTH CENPB-type domain-containing protein n=1 Tax=Aphanomyces astaci TaxID=112090 RepID=A0A397EIV0_APHAT|nr:hypothetical protein DYB25_006167 [Aphanomyces astaci]RHY86882.1 hypothetical protein DYB31_008318 [Aphanomyces astaci]RHY91008.1 hypothetical protein DYB35_012691 [Aphanomyces astaci]RHZ09109.1 hypothetical protein DYB26_009267 [Aphanomyces astaci]RHZ11565.1 hypothetical protein DYB37_012761 [Aphanomyces astaci]
MPGVRGRPRLPANASLPAKKRVGLQRKRLTYEEKLRVIEYHAEHGMPSTMDHFYPNVVGLARESARKNVHTWIATRASIAARASDPIQASHRCSRPHGVSSTLGIESEDRLVRWICELRTNGVPVTHSMLRDKALEEAESKGLSTDVFKAGESWIGSFKRRHGMDRYDHRRRSEHAENDEHDHN